MITQGGMATGSLGSDRPDAHLASLLWFPDLAGVPAAGWTSRASLAHRLQARQSPPIHVLMIEDDASIADMYSLQFEHDGYRVTVATTGEVGFASLGPSSISSSRGSRRLTLRGRFPFGLSMAGGADRGNLDPGGRPGPGPHGGRFRRPGGGDRVPLVPRSRTRPGEARPRADRAGPRGGPGPVAALASSFTVRGHRLHAVR